MVCGIRVVEVDQPGVHSVWSQVTDFPEVELRLLQKRDWRVVISQEWKFGDDILFARGTRSFSWFAGDGVCGTC